MTVFTRGQRVQFPVPYGDGSRALGTFVARCAGEDGPAARARVRDSSGALWKIPMRDIQDAASAPAERLLDGMTARDTKYTLAASYTEPSTALGLVPSIELAGVTVAAWIARGVLQVDVLTDDADPAAYHFFGPERDQVPVHIEVNDSVFESGPGIPVLDAALVARAQEAIARMQSTEDDEDSSHMDAIDAGQECAAVLWDLLLITGRQPVPATGG